MKPTHNQAVGGGVAGGGLALILVWLIPQVSNLVIQATEASALTIAIGSVVSFLARYLQNLTPDGEIP